MSFVHKCTLFFHQPHLDTDRRIASIGWAAGEADVDFSHLVAIDHRTRCPYKGYADHWRLADGEDPVAWTYREPYPQVAQLQGHVAFYQDRVAVEIGVATPAVVGYAR